MAFTLSHSTSPIFCEGFFRIGSCGIWPQTIAKMTGMHHHAQLLIEMVSCELLAWADLKWQSS
jgi:hypothetical protein